MGNRNILAIGASAGGVEALRFLASEFPADLDASILVVIHLSTQFVSAFDAILTQSGPLPATFAKEGETVEQRRIYIAPPGRHLILDQDRLQLGAGPRENNSRPSIDPMLRSVGLCCGPRAIGAVLTGTLGDGASGLAALKSCGGLTVVQDPNDAAFPEMPTLAMGLAKPDHVVGLAGMASLFEKLVQQPAGGSHLIPEGLKYEVEVARSGQTSMSDMDLIGRRSVLACPDCHGVMWEIGEGDLVRYRCHVGHAYTAELMALAIDENLNRAMGSALRALEERLALAEKLRAQAADSGHLHVAESWSRKATEFAQEAEVIRTSLRRMEEIAALKRT
jgi:two-component system, chemotaxis family, protein-glutamate methylesterase/glutaminase